MKKPTPLTIIGIFLILFIIILGTLFIKLMKENAKCELNPFVYGARKMAEQGLEIMCSCIPLNPEYAEFYFDKEDLIVQKDFISGISFNP